MATPDKWGSEFLVNTTTSQNQQESSVTALGDGKFVVVWEDNSSSGGDTSSLAVRGQIFNADGSTSGSEFLVNTTTANFQGLPSVSALANGAFVAVWHDGSASGDDTSGIAIRAQIFSSDGSTSGSEFVANTTTSSHQSNPVVCGLADGRFVIGWKDESGTSPDVRAQIFNADGTKAGSEFLVNTTTNDSQEEIDISARPDGGFVASWSDHSATGGDVTGAAMRAQVYDADGATVGGEFLVNTTTSNNQSVSSVATLSSGGFVIAWTDTSSSGGDTSGAAVRAQIFDPDGTASGSEFLVNTTTTANQREPEVTALADGRFVVSWADGSLSSDDPSNYATRAQIFGADGIKSGSEFLVNTTTTNQQFDVALTTLCDGRFVATWSDYSRSGGDTSECAIRGQIFEPRETAMSWSGMRDDDQCVGTTFDDTLQGRDGDDTIQGGNGRDIINGNGGADSILGENGNDLMSGDGGNDTLRGGFGFDELIGGAGNDSLDGEAGPDTMLGGAGDDTYVVDNANDSVIENSSEGTDTVRTDLTSFTLGDHLEDLIYTSGSNFTGTGNTLDNRITGGGGVDNLVGGDGNDTLDGGGDADNLTGGTGDDTYIVDNVADTLVENADEGTDEVQTSLANYTLDANFENLTATGAANFTGTGNALDNVITGPSFMATLEGAAGNDTLIGGGNLDDLRGDAGNDSLAGGNNGDSLQGGGGNDTLNGEEGPDTLLGGTGNDTYIVDNLGDILSEVGGGGVDKVIAAIEFTLAAGFENLTLSGAANLNGTGNALANTLVGNSGKNVLKGVDGNDKLYGGNHHDKLYGGNNDDRLYGGDGKDTLKGGGGKDKLYGDDGNDKLYGDGGTDTAVYTGGKGNYKIIKLSGGKIKVVDKKGDLGTDILASVEKLQFGSKVYKTKDVASSKSKAKSKAEHDDDDWHKLIDDRDDDGGNRNDEDDGGRGEYNDAVIDDFHMASLILEMGDLLV